MASTIRSTNGSSWGDFGSGSDGRQWWVYGKDSAPLIDVISDTNAGFSGEDPFPSGVEAGYTPTVDSGLNNFYFDAHNGITDSDSAWSNDSNAFTDNTTDYAMSTWGTSGGRLRGDGTTAPGSGPPITQVRVRVYGVKASPFGPPVSLFIYTESKAEFLVQRDTASSPFASWSAYSIVPPPTGGWTWEKVQNLVVECDPNGIDSAAECQVYKIEIEVANDTEPVHLSEGVYYWRARAKDPNGTDTWGEWSDTWQFIVLVVLSIVGYKQDGEFTFKPTLIKEGGEFVEKPLNKV